jgi:hypothetical protein
MCSCSGSCNCNSTTIPRGPAGPQGPTGPQGPVGNNGNNGITPTITVGDVTTVPFGDSATVTDVGTPPNAIFDFEIPEGEQGPPGEPAVGVKKILDETSEDAESSTSGATINNHSWTILDLTTNQDTVVFDFIITSNTGNGNFAAVAVNIGGTVISRFTDSDATLAAEIKYNTDPTDVPAGYISSSDPLLSEDINFIKGNVKITRRTDLTIEYDITYYMYNSVVQGSYSSVTNTKMVQKIFSTVGGNGVSSIDASGLNFSFNVTPNFMSGGATFGTSIRIYNAFKLESIL